MVSLEKEDAQIFANCHFLAPSLKILAKTRMADLNPACPPHPFPLTLSPNLSLEIADNRMIEEYRRERRERYERDGRTPSEDETDSGRDMRQPRRSYTDAYASG